MGDVVNMRDYKTKLERDPGLIRTREDAVDHLASELAKMLEEGDTLMVIPDSVEDYHAKLAAKAARSDQRCNGRSQQSRRAAG